MDDLERQLKNVMAERDKLVEIKRTLDEDLTVHRRKSSAAELKFTETERIMKVGRCLNPDCLRLVSMLEAK